MVPELRARRLKEIAARVESEFGGDLQAVLRRPLSEAKKVFKKFPTIGDPGAEKDLALHEDGASRGSSVELRPRPAAPRLWPGKGKTTPQRTVPRRKRCAPSCPKTGGAASRLSPDQAARAGAVQGVTSEVRTMPREP